IRTVAEQNARAADRQLESFAAKSLDKHPKLKLAPTGNLEAIVIARGRDTDGDIALGFALQAIANIPALHLVAGASRIGAVVDREAHRQRGWIDRPRFQGRTYR